jgi:peptidoglycan/xylan/chitin deacetylase (PgdA/CDA1 family)
VQETDETERPRRSKKALLPSDVRRSIHKAMVRAPIPTSDLGRRVVVLLYHSIHPSKAFASATPSLFSEHLAWIEEHCDLFMFEDALATASGPRRPRPRVAIVFDDGYADVHTYAVPALAERGIRATFFLTVGMMDRDPEVIARMAHLQRASADEVESLSWPQVIEMQQTGMVFGSHGVHHVNLARADAETVRMEARGSKERLEDGLGTEVGCFAYPFGKPKLHVTSRTMDLIVASGYRIAGTTTFRRVRPTDDPMAIPRISITNDPIEMLEAKVLGRLDLIGLYQLYAPAWASRVISPETSVTT